MLQENFLGKCMKGASGFLDPSLISWAGEGVADTMDPRCLYCVTNLHTRPFSSETPSTPSTLHSRLQALVRLPAQSTMTSVLSGSQLTAMPCDDMVLSVCKLSLWCFQGGAREPRLHRHACLMFSENSQRATPLTTLKMTRPTRHPYLEPRVVMMIFPRGSI